MNKEKPINCGCGGEAELEPRRNRAMYMCYALRCPCCGIEIRRKTESEAITAWNRAMGDRTAKVDRDAIFPVMVCGACHSTVAYPNNYCSDCGARLEWE